jgi:tRNA A-37 threonylcarbamoyl transferase component Bud32
MTLPENRGDFLRQVPTGLEHQAKGGEPIGASSPGTAPLTLPGTVAESPRLADGARIAGRYEVRGELGRGGFGVVFDAWDHELRRPVALKLRRADRTDRISERRFRAEAALARDVTHPNLVRAFDIGVDGDLVYLVLEKVDGSTLAKRLEEEGPLPVEATLVLADALLQALDALHSAGIVHRDVKPSNVLLLADAGDELRVKLGDLGVARRLDPLETRLTQSEVFVGTLAYLPPEILEGKEATFQSDLYSLGVTLCEALLGRIPGGTTNTLANVLSRRRKVHSAQALRAAQPEIPRWFAGWLVHLLESEPSKRYGSAATALADLRICRSPGRSRQAVRWLGLTAAVGLGLALAHSLTNARAPEYRGIRTDGEKVVAFGSRGQPLWTLENVRPGAIGTIPLVRLGRDGDKALAVIRYSEEHPVGADGAAALEFLDPETGRQVRRVELDERPGNNAFSEFSRSFVPHQISAIDLDEDGADEILVILNHLPSWPSLVVLYEPVANRSRVVFAGAGHQVFLAAGDLDGDDRKELLFSGYSSVLRRLRTLSAIKVAPWIGAAVVVPGREIAMSAELSNGPGANLLWQVILGRRGAMSLKVDGISRTIELQLEEGRRERLRFDGSSAALAKPREDPERVAQGAAYASLREALRLLALGEWSLGAREAERTEALAREAREPRLVEIAARFGATARIRGGDVRSGLGRLEELWKTSEDASEIAYDAAEALHLSGHLESAVTWYRRSSLRGGAPNLGKSKKDVLLGAVLALVELDRLSEARETIAWYQTSYGWLDSEVLIVNLNAYIDWRGGERGPNLKRFAVPTSLGFGWEWSLLALELNLAAGELPDTLLPRVEHLESLVTEGRGLFALLRAELLDRLGRAAEARAAATAGTRLLRPQHEVFEYAFRDLANERLTRLGDE